MPTGANLLPHNQLNSSAIHSAPRLPQIHQPPNCIFLRNITSSESSLCFIIRQCRRQLLTWRQEPPPFSQGRISSPAPCYSSPQLPFPSSDDTRIKATADLPSAQDQTDVIMPLPASRRARTPTSLAAPLVRYTEPSTTFNPVGPPFAPPFSHAALQLSAAAQLATRKHGHARVQLGAPCACIAKTALPCSTFPFVLADRLAEVGIHGDPRHGTWAIYTRVLCRRWRRLVRKNATLLL